MSAREAIAARLQRCEEYLHRLELFRLEERPALLADPVRRAALERYLHLALEALLDIGNHLLAMRATRKPETYQEVFTILAEEGLITEVIAKDTVGMAAFRNLLVHDYLRIDPQRLGEILDTRLPVMQVLAREFARQV